MQRLRLTHAEDFWDRGTAEASCKNTIPPLYVAAGSLRTHPQGTHICVGVIVAVSRVCYQVGRGQSQHCQPILCPQQVDEKGEVRLGGALNAYGALHANPSAQRAVLLLCLDYSRKWVRGCLHPQPSVSFPQLALIYKGLAADMGGAYCHAQFRLPVCSHWF